jgi:hypothetical protein
MKHQPLKPAEDASFDSAEMPPQFSRIRAISTFVE